MKNLGIINGTLVTPYGYKDDNLWIENKTIKSLSKTSDIKNCEIIDASGCYVTPGLIDIHTHGGVGCDFLFCSEKKMEILKKDLLRQGVTLILPTIMSAPLDLIKNNIEFLDNYIENQSDLLPEFYGINLEGPFISKKYRGMHAEKFLLELDTNNLKELLSPHIKIITIAPELDKTGKIIEFLVNKGIIVSCGHTAATYEESNLAFNKGAQLVTHLYNAMSPIHHRAPGIITASLVNDKTFIEIIADGIHVHKGSIEFAVKSKKMENIILISDSIPQRDCYSYVSEIEEYNISIENNKTSNPDGKISGSVLPLDQSVRNMVNWGIVDFKTAINFVTYNPARLLNINNYTGCIHPNYQSNIALWDKNTLDIKATIVKGLIYEF